MKYFYTFLLFFALLFFIPNLAEAKNHEVYVGTVENAIVFEPTVLIIAPGDNVTFVWTPGMAHNVASVDSSSSNEYNISGFRSGDIQDGGEWQLPSYFTSKEGTLYYVCEPHVNMGMTVSYTHLTLPTKA